MSDRWVLLGLAACAVLAWTFLGLRAGVRYRLMSIALAWLSPLVIHQYVSPKKEVVAAAAAAWLPGLLVATLRAYPRERPGPALLEHPLAPFAVLYGLAATYGLAWAFARGNDAVLAVGQTFTAGLFCLGFALAGPTLSRHATERFWLVLVTTVGILSLPGLGPALEWIVGTDSEFARFLDPVAVLAPVCTLIVLVLIYPRSPTLGVLGAGYFGFLTLLTFTRSYWLGAVGALMFLALASIRGLEWTNLRDRLLRPSTAARVAVLGACVAAMMVATPIGGFASARLTLDAAQGEDLSLVVRDNEIAAALAHVRAHPITGLGSGGEYLSLYQTSAATARFGLTNFVHNAYVYFPLKFGLLGFGALAALAIGTLSVAVFALRRRGGYAPGRGLFTAAFIFVLLASITAPNLVDPRYSLLSGAVAWLAGASSQGLASSARSLRTDT
jgi:O-antigen ligase